MNNKEKYFNIVNENISRLKSIGPKAVFDYEEKLFGKVDSKEKIKIELECLNENVSKRKFVEDILKQFPYEKYIDEYEAIISIIELCMGLNTGLYTGLLYASEELINQVINVFLEEKELLDDTIGDRGIQ